MGWAESDDKASRGPHKCCVFTPAALPALFSNWISVCIALICDVHRPFVPFYVIIEGYAKNAVSCWQAKKKGKEMLVEVFKPLMLLPFICIIFKNFINVKKFIFFGE